MPLKPKRMDAPSSGVRVSSRTVPETASVGSGGLHETIPVTGATVHPVGDAGVCTSPPAHARNSSARATAHETLIGGNAVLTRKS